MSLLNAFMNCQSTETLRWRSHLFYVARYAIAVYKIFTTSYTGTTEWCLSEVRYGVTLSFLCNHFKGRSSWWVKNPERQKLDEAKEYSREYGSTSFSERTFKVNWTKQFQTKKNFKELFGVPVFKYLQHERLNKAHELLTHRGMSIQEVAGLVGYESISSFSSAFLKKFGIRPSVIKK